MTDPGDIEEPEPVELDVAELHELQVGRGQRARRSDLLFKLAFAVPAAIAFGIFIEPFVAPVVGAFAGWSTATGILARRADKARGTIPSPASRRRASLRRPYPAVGDRELAAARKFSGPMLLFCLVCVALPAPVIVRIVMIVVTVLMAYNCYAIRDEQKQRHQDHQV